MEKKIISALGLVLFLTACQHNNLTDDSPFNFEPAAVGIAKGATVQGAKAFVGLEGINECSPIPTLDEVKTGKWEFWDALLTKNEAVKLGIPIAKVDVSHNFSVYVKDFKRYKLCDSEDGTQVLYGQIIRTTIEIENYDISTGIDLASIAASGTLGRQSQKFYFYKDGFYNPKIDEIIAEVSGKIFDVPNYSLYQNVMGEIMKLLKEADTVYSVNMIGIKKEITSDDFLRESPIVARTLYSIKKGKKCMDIKSEFKQDPFASSVIERVFRAMDLDCTQNTEPDEQAKLKAKTYLQGIVVKN